MILIDVRTKEEYNAGHINSAMLCDVMNMMQGILPDIHKDEEITVYCASGSRSKMAKIILEQAGFKRITDAGSISNFKSPNHF